MVGSVLFWFYFIFCCLLLAAKCQGPADCFLFNFFDYPNKGGLELGTNPQTHKPNVTTKVNVKEE